VVVLVIVSVLALLGASFSYYINAQLASVQALQDQQQARFAAETGIHRAVELLREGRWDMTNWYNNYRVFRRIPVYVPEGKTGEEGKGGSESVADQEKVEGRSTWRFSIVAYERSEDQTDRAKIRYGLTDEASKLNLNTATRSQLLALFDSIRHDNVTSEQLADALIDWRDRDDEVSPRGAESSYYMTLHPAYRAKNAPLTSVEELLMIKGFNGRILYGEDYNRNGYMDENENDGEEGAFPPDDGDGQLNQGLLPYVTVYSWDWNRSNDNKLRVDINTVRFDQVAGGGGDGAGGGGAGGGQAPGAGGDAGGGAGGLAAFASKVPTHITEEIRPEVIDFIAEAQRRGYKFRSIGDLLGLEVYEDGTSNHDQMWRDYARKFRQAERRTDDEQQQNGEDDQADEEMGDDEWAGEEEETGRMGRRNDRGRNDESGDFDDEEGGAGNRGRSSGFRNGRDRSDGGNNSRFGGGNNNRGNRDDRGDDAFEDEESNRPGRRSSNDLSPAIRFASLDSDSKTYIRLTQSIRDDQDGAGGGPPRGGGAGGRGGFGRGGSNRGDAADGNMDRDGPDAGGDSRRGGRGRGRQAGPPGDGVGGGPGDGDFGDDRPGGRRGRGRGRDNAGGQGGGSGAGGGTPLVSPVEVSDMPVLCDRLCTWNSPVMAGLINVNTAPAPVLRTIPGLEEEDVESIISKRASLEPADKLTIAWLVTSGAITPEKFALISNLVTTRSLQFTIDAIGFADHVGTVKRIQAVVEMRGQLAQFKYYRDITSLGIGYPVWDDERSEGFAFTNR